MLEISVFARAPVLGRVKSRLAERIGAAEALAVYVALLRRSIDAVVEACRGRDDLVPVLWHAGEWPGSFPLPPSITAGLRRQPHEQMLDNLREVFRRAPRSTRRGAIAVGVDHPEIEAAHVLSMASLLDGAEVSVGPAEDGGFWSLGATVDLGGVLQGLPLGTGTALSALERAVRGAGLSLGRGPTLYDIDTAEDLRRWRGQIHRE
jgi:hypothetical protein